MSKNTKCTTGVYHDMIIDHTTNVGRASGSGRYQVVIVRCLICGATADVDIDAEDQNWSPPKEVTDGRASASVER